jgi:hypothetical protein
MTSWPALATKRSKRANIKAFGLAHLIYSVALVECGIRENLAEYYGQKSAATRLEGVGREAGQTPIFFTQARNGD